MVSLAFAMTFIAPIAAGDGPEQPVSSGPEQRASSDTATSAPSTNAPEPTGVWLPGLPIDTPPAVASPLFAAPPAAEEKHWAEIAAWAANTCGFDGGQVEGPPEAMFKTTAGELRRRSAEESPGGSTLGSNWQNEDALFVVVYRGDFPVRSGPPWSDGSTPKPLPDDTTCIYFGNGRVDENENGMVGHMTLQWAVNAI
jgi:hypothetical protein